MATKVKRRCRNWGVSAVYWTFIACGVALFLVMLKIGEGYVTTKRDNVVLTHVHFRHGDRTPLYTIPSDTRDPKKLWKVGMSQLTELGKKQGLELGKWLRNRYSNLLPATYHPDDILVKSTDKDRTLMTAQAVLAGLYPAPEQPASPFSAQLVPIHTAPEGCDTLIADHKPCPRYYAIREMIWNSTEINCVMDKHSELLNYLSQHSGIPRVGIHDATDYISDPIFVQEGNNVELPAWAKTAEYDRKTLDELTILEYMIMPAFTTELKRLQTGNVMSEMLTHMLRKKSGELSPDRKMFLYSGHDSTVGPLMHTLGVYDAIQVPYAAALMIDLVLEQGHYFVKIRYKNSTNSEPNLLTIPGCEPSCPLDEFERRMKIFVPTDWKKECNDLDMSNAMFDYTFPSHGNMDAWIDCFDTFK